MVCVPLLVLSAGAGRCYATRSKPPACAHCTQSREEFATRVSWCPAPAMATPPLWWTSCSQVTVTFLMWSALRYNSMRCCILYSGIMLAIAVSRDANSKKIFISSCVCDFCVFVVWHADCTVPKRVPIIGTGSLKGPFWCFGSLFIFHGPYFQCFHLWNMYWMTNIYIYI